MINNQKCDSCAFATKCVAKAKLKPFSSEARVDFGVVLDFKNCKDYKTAPKPAKEEEEKEE